ncbi:conserved hypothetical protein [Histoplasma capsulatum var. duboisii H88]|uniref:Uncharacterized protein n=1 Tax=Ajellomyces capsulatus (strain H88) TaxID=544711 RepID=F0UHL4_AJEC8|nr:conserved hypothetical protein [Histoplasma capsulatum var. duboisii H88]
MAFAFGLRSVAGAQFMLTSSLLWDDQRPSGHLFFDRKLSKTSVHLAPSSFHGSAVHHILGTTWDVIKSKVPKYFRRLDIQTNEREGRRADFTTKVPDVMLSYAPDAESIKSPFVLTEVGFTESYKDLVKTMQFWLDNHEEINLAFLIKFQESPEYSAKKCFAALPEDVVADWERYANDRAGFKVDASEGLLRAYGAPLVGRTTAFLEIWERKGKSGSAGLRGERIHFYNSAEPANPPPSLVLGFDEFGLPIEELRGQKIDMAWSEWAEKVNNARKKLAWNRFGTILYTYATTPKDTKTSREK